MPCFEGLFGDEHDDSIQDVLFSTAAFHGFSKCRMHTDNSLDIYEGLTASLGHTMRQFTSTVCEDLEALPLAREEGARASRRAKARARSHSHPRSRSHSQTRKSPQQKKFNMFTYKWHALGHYPNIIRNYGTLDLLGTHIVCVSYLRVAINFVLGGD